MKTYNAQPISKEKYRLGEAPFYDVRTGMRSYVDIIAGKFYILDEAGNLTETDFGQQIGAAVPMQEISCYVAAGKDGLYVFDGKEITLKKDLTGVYESYQRSNDAKADPKGRLWFGSSTDGDDHGFSGNLYCYNRGNISVKQPDTRISNGMAWNKNRDKFFFSDSEFHAVFTYDYDFESGAVSGRTVLFEITDGVPDGLCIDDDDNLWVAIWGGSRIEKRSSVTGELLEVIKVPAEHTTSCCFYGKDMDTLFITSSGEGLSGEHDGCLFSCKVDAKGLPCDYAIM